MKINHVSSTYSVVEHCKGVYHLVKIIGEYSTRQEAFSDMVNIFERRKTEEEVERVFKNEKTVDLV